MLCILQHLFDIFTSAVKSNAIWILLLHQLDNIMPVEHSIMPVWLIILCMFIIVCRIVHVLVYFTSDIFIFIEG